MLQYVGQSKSMLRSSEEQRAHEVALENMYFSDSSYIYIYIYIDVFAECCIS